MDVLGQAHPNHSRGALSLQSGSWIPFFGFQLQGWDAERKDFQPKAGQGHPPALNPKPKLGKGRQGVQKSGRGLPKGREKHAVCKVWGYYPNDGESNGKEYGK